MTARIRSSAYLAALEDARSALTRLERRSIRRSTELTDELVRIRKERERELLDDDAAAVALGELRMEALRFAW